MYTRTVHMYRQISKTYDLLDKKNKTKFSILVLVQMFLGLLDFLAIIVVAIFSYVGSAFIGISKLSNGINDILLKLGFSTSDLENTLFFLIVIVVFLFTLKSFLSLLFLKKTFKFLANRIAEISEKVGTRFFSSDYQNITIQSSQEATYSIGRSLHLGEVLGGATVVIAELSMLTLLAGLICIFDPLLAATLLIYFILLFYLSQKKTGSWMRKNSRALSSSMLKGDQTFQESIALYRELFVANKLQLAIEKFVFYRRLEGKANANIQFIAYIPKLTFESALIFGACLVGIQQVLTGSSQGAISNFVIFMAAGSRILPSMLRLQTASSSIQSVSGASELAFKLIRNLGSDINVNLEASEKNEPIRSEFIPEIEISKLGFNYQSSKLFQLNDISILIPSGESLGIVGKSGSGKSTLADLIMGIHEPKSGSIKVSGVSPRTAIKNWPGSIAYVPQVVNFVNGTIRENIMLGITPSESHDERIWNCLQVAHLDGLLSKSKEGLDTQVGERGLQLSGGQRQRLGIARALFSNPKLLILDEATSALDAETEDDITQTFQKLSQTVTLIVIAHRISTIKSLKQIIYLEDGHIVGMGSFDEVRNQNPNFNAQVELLNL